MLRRPEEGFIRSLCVDRAPIPRRGGRGESEPAMAILDLRSFLVRRTDSEVFFGGGRGEMAVLCLYEDTGLR